MPSKEETERFLQQILLDDRVKVTDEAAEMVRGLDLARIERLPGDDRDAILDAFRTALPQGQPTAAAEAREAEERVVDDAALRAGLAAVRRRVAEDKGQLTRPTVEALTNCALLPAPEVP
jgi:hypothetical protein